MQQTLGSSLGVEMPGRSRRWAEPSTWGLRGRRLKPCLSDHTKTQVEGQILRDVSWHSLHLWDPQADVSARRGHSCALPQLPQKALRVDDAFWSTLNAFWGSTRGQAVVT